LSFAKFTDEKRDVQRSRVLHAELIILKLAKTIKHTIKVNCYNNANIGVFMRHPVFYVVTGADNYV